jgi:Uma2 family endonuclease
MSLLQNAWRVVPDLAVEVVSPHDRAMKLERKLTEYFESGVRRVWVVHPEEKFIKIYKSRHEIRVFDSKSELVDEEVLPGFRLSVRSVFPPQQIEAKNPAAD